MSERELNVPQRVLNGREGALSEGTADHISLCLYHFTNISLQKYVFLRLNSSIHQTYSDVAATGPDARESL